MGRDSWHISYKNTLFAHTFSPALTNTQEFMNSKEARLNKRPGKIGLTELRMGDEDIHIESNRCGQTRAIKKGPPSQYPVTETVKSLVPLQLEEGGFHTKRTAAVERKRRQRKRSQWETHHRGGNKGETDSLLCGTQTKEWFRTEMS